MGLEVFNPARVGMANVRTHAPQSSVWFEPDVAEVCAAVVRWLRWACGTGWRGSMVSAQEALRARSSCMPRYFRRPIQSNLPTYLPLRSDQACIWNASNDRRALLGCCFRASRKRSLGARKHSESTGKQTALLDSRGAASVPSRSRALSLLSSSLNFYRSTTCVYVYR